MRSRTLALARKVDAAPVGRMARKGALARGRADRGDRAGTRRSIATRQALPPEAMVRFVIGPDGAVVPDIAARLPGRGLWLEARRDMVELACARNLFAKSARAHARVPADLADRVEESLRQRCLDLLGLARRAGQAVAGFERVSERLRAGGEVILVQAVDAAPAPRARLRALAGGATSVELLDGSALGSVFGRDVTAHIALDAGRLAAAFQRETARLAGFRPGFPNPPCEAN